ncbi:hypothetical protein [Crenobacter intestini]|uniref:hypothetical protein n=1 Tax=Crenobacter intestini TaxID=2563443 RepID=UPI00196B7124|nr:hypothetical protein [Crenobacter intestini]
MTDYYDALERLVAGTPKVVALGTKITNDAVALEAGRGKGSIKKSRDIFADLIVAIDQAAEAQAKAAKPDKERLAKLKASADDYREKWEAALGREVCLLREVYELKKQLAALTGGSVLPIRGGNGE